MDTKILAPVSKLKKSTALQDAIFNSQHFSSIATDALGVIQIFNVGAETMLGFKASEVLNIMTPADLCDKAELKARADSLSLTYGVPIQSGFEALIYKAALGIEDHYELTYICKDGRHLPAQLSVTALRDEHELIIGYLLIATDNSASKHAEKINRITSLAFESAQSMYIADHELYFVHANRAFLESTGYSLTDLVNQKTSILKSGRHDSEFFKNLWQTLEATGTWSGELWNKRKNGDIYLELTHIIAVTDAQVGSTHYVVNGVDISPLKAYELDLIDAKEKAERFSTLKSQFIANMSHEIRTPMAAIMGFSEFALYEDDPAEIKTYLRDISTASTSLLGILQDILDFTKLEAGYIAIESIPFDVMDLLGTISSLFSSTAQRKGLEFTIERDRAIPLELLGDRLRLQQVLTNLVGNALKFTAQGSVKLEITLQNINMLQVQVLFSVTDTGIGIAPEDQGKLFQPFSQADDSFARKYGGTGLGLIISKELVQLMGGEISLVSHKDQGSTFSFAVQLGVNRELKSLSTELMPLMPLAAQITNNKFKGYRMLVVEDNDMALKLIQKYLHLLGIDIKIATHGKQALALLEQYEFDAVLMDIHMPIMTGIEVTQKIRQQAKFAKLPIIALSAGVTETGRNDCIAAGMVDFISKPIDVEKLCAVLEHWLKPNADATK